MSRLRATRAAAPIISRPRSPERAVDQPRQRQRHADEQRRADQRRRRRIVQRPRQLVSEAGERDDERAHPEDGADDEIAIARRVDAPTTMFGEHEGRGHFAHEKDGERAVALQRAADAGDPFAAQSLNAPQAHPAADREADRRARQASRHRVDRPEHRTERDAGRRDQQQDRHQSPSTTKASMTIGSAYHAWRCGASQAETSCRSSVGAGIHFHTAASRPQKTRTAETRSQTSRISQWLDEQEGCPIGGLRQANLGAQGCASSYVA